MKRVLLLLIASTLVFAACKKKAPEEEEKPDKFELPYSTESIAANKAFIESQARHLVKETEDLAKEKAIKTLQTLASLELPELSFLTESLEKVGKSKDKVAALSSTMHTMTNATTSEEVFKLNNAFGIYTYNSVEDSWTKTSANDRIELKFPSTKDGKTNNASLSILSKNSGISISTENVSTTREYDPETGDYVVTDEEIYKLTFELPSEIKVNLKVDGASSLDLNSTYSYHADGLPKEIKSELTIGAYKMLAELSNDNKEAKSTFTFKKGAQDLISINGGSKLNDISLAKLKNEEEIVADLISNANISMVLGKLEIHGIADFKQIQLDIKSLNLKEPNYNDYFKDLKYPEYADYPNKEAYDEAVDKYNADWRKIYEKYTSDTDTYEKDYYTGLSKALNLHTKLIVLNAEKEKIIASIVHEFVETIIETDTESSYSAGIEQLLLFGDGSKVSLKTFGDTGFETLKDNLESFLKLFKED